MYWLFGNHIPNPIASVAFRVFISPSPARTVHLSVSLPLLRPPCSTHSPTPAQSGRRRNISTTAWASHLMQRRNSSLQDENMYKVKNFQRIVCSTISKKYYISIHIFWVHAFHELERLSLLKGSNPIFSCNSQEK